MSATDLLGGDWIQAAVERGPALTDDLVGAALPLLEQVAECHEQGRVAPLQGLDRLGFSAGSLWFPWDRAREPELELEALRRMESGGDGALDVVGRFAVQRDGDWSKVRNLEVQGPTEAAGALGGSSQEAGQDALPLGAPVYCPDWVTWEQQLGHHDALSDVLLCGQILAALALGLDLGTSPGLEAFAAARSNLFERNPGLHPVVAMLIVAMTELDRHRRVQDMRSCVETLRFHRRVSLPASLPVTSGDGQRASAEPELGGRERVLGTLRERLFEISRRNRLLYFRSTQAMVNLTAASVPVLLDPQHVDPETLCTWSSVGPRLGRGESLNLGELLRFEDAAYLPGQLDRLRAEDRRHRSEYGLSQLRLCPVMLRWHDLKGEKAERITSPLLLLPVRLQKQKGVRDRYLLEPAGTVAEVNPVLRHHLANLYGLQLPAAVDLAETSLVDWHGELERQILASEPGVTLNLIERPPIQIVHHQARLRLENYRRRTRLQGRGIKRLGDVDYSYRRDNFQPLGLQLFTQRVQPADWPLATLSGCKPRPRMPAAGSQGAGAADAASKVSAGPPSTLEGTTYSLESDAGDNPYVWDFDLCSVTLGHFHYRRMSLVRDYEQLVQEPDQDSRSFGELFGERSRQAEEESIEALDWGDHALVVPADPTQAAAVARGRGDASFIVQGPPGTGKSQTITNLIADAVSRGGRVLFVCEKRAALDVVFTRLEGRGLGRLCCLIHDSQGDKKAFIHDLRETYDEFQDGEGRLSAVRGKRTRAGNTISAGAQQLRALAEAMLSSEDADGLHLRQVVSELVELGGELPDFDEREAEAFPSLGRFVAGEEHLIELEERLLELGGPERLGEHGLRHLAPEQLHGDQPVTEAGACLGRVQQSLQRVEQFLGSTQLGPLGSEGWSDLEDLVAHARRLEPLSRKGVLSLLDPASAVSARLEQELDEERKLVATEQEAAQRCERWGEPFEARNLADVRDLAGRVEGRWYRFLLPGWYRLKKLMAARYDLGAHDVQPSFTRLLDELGEWQAASRRLEEQRVALRERYLAVEPGQDLAGQVAVLRSAELGPLAARLQQICVESAGEGDPLGPVLEAGEALGQLRGAAEELLAPGRAPNLDRLRGSLAELEGGLRDLPELLPMLRELSAEGPELLLFLGSRSWSRAQFRGALLRRVLDLRLRADGDLRRMGQAEIEELVTELDRQRDRQLDSNAELVVEQTRARFHDHLARSSQAKGDLEPGEKDWRKAYARGRKGLEHEFGKVMRYRAIRDLAAEDTGLVLRDLKPIWLMSPLSVSDTLPLDPELFDLVVFDEASQIPLEEAVPTLFRGARCVVVGDTMQLPPTNFFAAGPPQGYGASQGAEAPADVLDGDFRFDLGAESLLVHADRSLPSVRLGWHYRSRSEALIDFSNAAFYERELLTIPDAEQVRERAPILCEAPEEADSAELARVTLDRPLSFHHLPSAVYAKRRNADEAQYVARLVCGLLAAAPERSIGVVAFSEAQQGELEQALERLAQEDERLREALDPPLEADGSEAHEPLFIKNLENVQGDERDVIVMSICYGPDEERKMRMNFGPINKGGGEKRLNVVFSRARRHMAVVSSITGDRITNDYNDGAACLKRYLRYAEACSRGDSQQADRVLDECSPPPAEALAARESEPVVDAVAAWLVSEGWCVERAVGQSRFRVDLGVRAPGEPQYRLGVLVDTEGHYAAGDVIEQYCQRPSVLRAFDWRLERVLGSEWLLDPGAQQQRLAEVLGPLPQDAHDD